MTKLAWDSVGEKFFELGVDRGVLYVSGKAGVAWNGLINVNENPTGGTAKGYYIDGFKYSNEATPEEFSGTIEAYTYPKEFATVDGSPTSGMGLSYGQQRRYPFGLSYRTLIGNDVNRNLGYKIHLVYNALATPTTRSNKTNNRNPEAMSFSWSISTTPIRIAARRPTAHLVIDSTESTPEQMTALENILYGTSGTAPRLPTPDEVVTLFDDWPTLEIVKHASSMPTLKYRGLPDLKGNASTGLYVRTEDSRLTPTAVNGLYTLG